jgi:hypothetical protein
MSKLMMLYSKDEFEVLKQRASVYYHSGMLNACYKKAEQVLFAIELGATVGLSPVAALLNISIINGKPGLSADAQLAIARNSGELVTFEERIEGEGKEMVAICTLTRKNYSQVSREFSVADAIKAGLWDRVGPWKSYPTRMLQMRARTFCLRDQFGDYLLGLCHSTEELEDMVDITPKTSQEASTQDLIQQTYIIDGVVTPKADMLQCLAAEMLKVDSQEGFYGYEEWKMQNEIEIKRWMRDSKGTKDLLDYRASFEALKHAIRESNENVARETKEKILDTVPEEFRDFNIEEEEVK